VKYAPVLFARTSIPVAVQFVNIDPRDPVTLCLCIFFFVSKPAPRDFGLDAVRRALGSAASSSGLAGTTE